MGIQYFLDKFSIFTFQTEATKSFVPFQCNLCQFLIESLAAEVRNMRAVEFFTISLQYKNANIANFVLGVPLQIN